MKSGNRISLVAFIFFIGFCTSGAVAQDALVALQSADAGCGTGVGRYQDCGNGTVTDNQSGLTWTKSASCWRFTAGAAAAAAWDTWDGASIEVLNLAEDYVHCNLTDGSRPGDWRLPTKAEWDAMIRDAVAKNCQSPPLTDDSGDVCHSATPSSFKDIITSQEFGGYWTATTEGDFTKAYVIDLNALGSISPVLKTGVRYFWAVRGGQ